MEPKHTARERIYLQWQQNIEAYMDELQQIDSTVRQLTHQLPDMLLLQHLIVWASLFFGQLLVGFTNIQFQVKGQQE